MNTVQSLNHLALQTRDAQALADFYCHYAGMEIVHDRREDDSRIIWVRRPEQPDGFMLVLLQIEASFDDTCGRTHHLGFYVSDRAAVDDIARQARQAGILDTPPVDAGGAVGYYCLIRDPDGNRVEFSCEQLEV